MAKVLIGFMGSGKSTLAKSLDPHYIDLDALIEEEIGMSIARYFQEEGQEAFRRVESKLLKQELTTDAVIATGGGVIEDATNRQLLSAHDEVIYLKGSFQTLYQRIAADQVNQRPLFLSKTREELEILFDKRAPLYESVANRVIFIDGKTPEEIVEEIL